MDDYSSEERIAFADTIKNLPGRADMSRESCNDSIKHNHFELMENINVLYLAATSSSILKGDLAEPQSAGEKIADASLEKKSSNAKADPTLLCEVVYTDDAQRRLDQGGRAFPCHTCGKVFWSSGNLKTHMRVHSGERPHPCSVCQQRFSTASNLKTHMRTHTLERPYLCDRCQQRFATSSNLKVHYRNHTGERPYQCDTCGRHFTGLGNYKCHLLIHTGEKRFHCSVCNRGFTSSSNLKIHVRGHTGFKPFQCSLCSQQFATKSNLNTHAKSKSCTKLFTCKKCHNHFLSFAVFRVHITSGCEGPGVDSELVTSPNKICNSDPAGHDSKHLLPPAFKEAGAE